MMISSFILRSFYATCIFAGLIACKQQSKKKENKEDPPPAQGMHYQLDKPQVFGMPAVLNEISGISFRNGVPDTVYAEQDDEGRLFRLQLGQQEPIETKFARKGDYEDIQAGHDQVYVLRSDGVLYLFPYVSAGGKSKDATVEFKDLLPAGEYEGLYLDDANGKLYILCKHCNEKIHKTNTGYIFTTGPGSLAPAGSFTLPVEEIAEKAGVKKMGFEPSALAWNEQLQLWYILSSVNKLLVTADKNWKPVNVYPLDPSLYNQPEGIAFDRNGDLYISNEKGKRDKATILKIPYHKTP